MRQDAKLLMKKTLLLKECADAYGYAVEVVASRSLTAEAICQSCAEVCYRCAEESKKLGDDLVGGDVYQMCLNYAALCEKILSYRDPVPVAELRESI